MVNTPEKKLAGVWITNLFSRSQITGLIQNRFETTVLQNLEELEKFATENPDAPVIVDLEDATREWVNLKRVCRDLPDICRRIVAFYPHVRTDLAEQSQDAGITNIYPRSKFFRDPIRLLEAF